jgi:periplasmic protein TonB
MAEMERSAKSELGSRLALAGCASLCLHTGAALWLGALPAGSLQPESGAAASELTVSLPRKMPMSPAAADPGRRAAPETRAGAEGFGSGVYYRASELDHRPAPRSRIDPPYPAFTGDERAYLVLRLLINESGAVDKVIPLVGDSGSAFERSAVEAFAAAQFTPGVRAGVPVKSQLTVEVKFDPGELRLDPDALTRLRQASAIE